MKIETRYASLPESCTCRAITSRDVLCYRANRVALAAIASSDLEQRDLAVGEVADDAHSIGASLLVLDSDGRPLALVEPLDGGDVRVTYPHPAHKLSPETETRLFSGPTVNAFEAFFDRAHEEALISRRERDEFVSAAREGRRGAVLGAVQQIADAAEERDVSHDWEEEIQEAERALGIRD